MKKFRRRREVRRERLIVLQHQRKDYDFKRKWMTMYRICSIRRCGYYLFHCAILCGFYSRVATNWERRLLNSAFSVKSFVIVRVLRKASFIRLTKNCNAVTWFWSKPSSLISRRFATKRYLHGTSNAFPQMISHDDHPLCLKKMTNFSGQPAFLYLLTGYCVLAEASIRERLLFCSARPEAQRQFESRTNRERRLIEQIWYAALHNKTMLNWR